MWGSVTASESVPANFLFTNCGLVSLLRPAQGAGAAAAGGPMAHPEDCLDTSEMYLYELADFDLDDFETCACTLLGRAQASHVSSKSVELPRSSPTTLHHSIAD
jgi:hypothetical protein